MTPGEEPAPAGWISARDGKWHRATTARPVFTRDERAACGMTFRPLNVTWDGDPPARPQHLCQRAGCRTPAAPPPERNPL